MKKSMTILLFIAFFVAIFATACNSKTDDKYDYLVLVNKYSQLPDDWEKNVELVDAKNAWDEDIKIEKETYESYKKLKEDLEKNGITIELDSVYRSVKAQQELWDDWSNDPEKGLEYVKKYVAVPGYSEHHTGLAVDICLKKNGKLISDNDEMIAEKDIFSKIHAKLADYGFILRYLNGKDDITGYAYEPWHLRYVGSKEIAKDIMDKNLTFEEYLDSIKDIVNTPAAAKYQVEKVLKDQLENKIFKDEIENSRFNVTKIYTKNDVDNNDTIKSLNLGKDDIAFEVTYQLQPKDGVDLNKLMVPDGEYDEKLGWVVDINRLGILRKDNNKYKLDNFGTGW